MLSDIYAGKYLDRYRYLEHHGVIGMKWGIRRFQNKDGTLTPRGKKKYIKELSKIKEKERRIQNKRKTQDQFQSLKERKKQLKKGILPSDKKEQKPMGTEELRKVVERLELEKRYNKAQPVSRNAKIRKILLDDILIPSTTDIARSTLTREGKKMVDKLLSDVDEEQKKKRG